VSFSILLLTYNEEINLPACLAAISWCNDIIVVDSFSNDKTVDIARSAGALVIQRKFDNFASQRNFALEHVSFKHGWVFHLDADEIFTNELKQEIEQELLHATYEAYRVPSKMILFGKWLRFSGMYPTYQVRLSKTPNFRFVQVGHGQREDLQPEKVGTLRHPYLHYSFSKGLSDWFEKHNRYAAMEAYETIQQLKEGHIRWAELFSADTTIRRRALKNLSCRLPFRPLLRFIYMYFYRLGILDGRQGLTYCTLLSIYEYMIVLSLRERRMKETCAGNSK
jgi:glycosyltransferase involved in cell wall biosynthesis